MPAGEALIDSGPSKHKQVHESDFDETTESKKVGKGMLQLISCFSKIERTPVINVVDISFSEDIREGTISMTGFEEDCAGYSKPVSISIANIPIVKERKLKPTVARALSWHEDSIQCSFCLRRISKVDVKHHASTCELRTEICRLLH